MPIHFALVTGAGEKFQPNALAVILYHVGTERGHKVTVAHASPSAAPVKADCALLHIDATKVDPATLPVFASGMPVLNARALDISKKRVSANLIGPDDDYMGPVILKTDDNAYGIPSFPPSPVDEAILNLRRLVTRENWNRLRMLPLYTYPILRDRTEVPAWVWSSEDIVVERFLPEREDDLFVLRLWIFLGRQDVVLKLYGRDPIVKSGELVRWEFSDRVPDELRRERQRLGFDFGKFDYVMHDGKAVLLDANKTPTVGKPGERSAYAVKLAEDFFDRFPESL